MRILAVRFFEALILPWIRLIYRVRLIHGEKMPKDGGVLLCGNHVTPHDSILHYLVAPRRLRFLTLTKYFYSKQIGWFMRLFDCIPMDRTQPKAALVAMIAALKDQNLICMFPEGGLTRSGGINFLNKGCIVMARRSGAAIVPTYTDGLWESRLSRNTLAGARQRIACPCQIAYADPIPAEEASIDKLFEGMLAASLDAFCARSCFQIPLELQVVRQLKKNSAHPLLEEWHSHDRIEIYTRNQALQIARQIATASSEYAGTQIGVALPGGSQSALLNLGLFLAGVIPINLPPQTNLADCSLQKLNLSTVIDSSNVDDYIQSSLNNPPYPLAKLKNRPLDRQAIGWAPDIDAAPIFLSSLEIYRNALQIGSGAYIQYQDRILCESPLDHVVGQMMHLWLPILNHSTSIGRHLDARSDSALLHRLASTASVMVAEHSLYQSLIARGSPIGSPTLRYGITFSSAPLDPAWETALNLPLLQGWSHAGRIVTMSLPPETTTIPGAVELMDRRPGSVGRFLPGITARKQATGQFQLRFDPDLESWIDVGTDPFIDAQGFLFLA